MGTSFLLEWQEILKHTNSVATSYSSCRVSNETYTKSLLVSAQRPALEVYISISVGNWYFQILTWYFFRSVPAEVAQSFDPSFKLNTQNSHMSSFFV